MEELELPEAAAGEPWPPVASSGTKQRSLTFYLHGIKIAGCFRRLRMMHIL